MIDIQDYDVDDGGRIDYLHPRQSDPNPDQDHTDSDSSSSDSCSDQGGSIQSSAASAADGSNQEFDVGFQVSWLSPM